MNINGKITLLASEQGLDIEVHDSDSGTTFVRGHLSIEQLGQALGRLAHTPMESCEVYGLDRVGKVLEMDSIEFPLEGKDCGLAGNP